MDWDTLKERAEGISKISLKESSGNDLAAIMTLLGLTIAMQEHIILLLEEKEVEKAAGTHERQCPMCKKTKLLLFMGGTFQLTQEDGKEDEFEVKNADVYYVTCDACGYTSEDICQFNTGEVKEECETS